MRALRTVFAVAVGFGLLLAIITSFIAFGYLIKIIALLLALFGTLALIGFVIYEFFREIVFKKGGPPK